MRNTLFIAGAMFTLALTALPALPAAAEDDPNAVDCFFAENRDDPLCRKTALIAAAPASAPVSTPLKKYAASQEDNASVDCFFSENRQDPLCSETR